MDWGPRWLRDWQLRQLRRRDGWPWRQRMGWPGCRRLPWRQLEVQLLSEQLGPWSGWLGSMQDSGKWLSCGSGWTPQGAGKAGPEGAAVPVAAGDGGAGVAAVAVAAAAAGPSGLPPGRAELPPGWQPWPTGLGMERSGSWKVTARRRSGVRHR
jgi:hypothetical protein